MGTTLPHAATAQHRFRPSGRSQNVKGNAGAVRQYTGVAEILAEEGNARVWGGMHWRHSTEVGTKLGMRVGKYTATHLLKPLDD